MFYIDVYNIWAHNSNYNYFHNIMCHNSKAAPDGKFAIFYLNVFHLPISSYLILVRFTQCLIIFAGLGFICSKVCFRCVQSYSYRCLDLFGLNLLFWSRERWPRIEIIRLLNNIYTMIDLHLFSPFNLCFWVLSWFELLLFSI